MQTSLTRDNSTLTISVSGRVDTVSAPVLDQFIVENTEGVTDLILDLAEMPYTSSAGLRVLLKAQKMMNEAQGTMKLIHVQEDVMEVLDMTGFTDIIHIE